VTVATGSWAGVEGLPGVSAKGEGCGFAAMFKRHRNDEVRVTGPAVSVRESAVRLTILTLELTSGASSNFFMAVMQASRETRAGEKTSSLRIDSLPS
jgi:hypothetical protein